MNLLEFDDNDWDIWSGCESPRPLRCEVECLTGDPITVIIDGVDVIICGDESEVGILGNHFSYHSEGIAMIAVLSLGQPSVPACINELRNILLSFV